jgi:hypothetical protein
VAFTSTFVVKNPENRATATQLLQHEFIASAAPGAKLVPMITEAKEKRENAILEDDSDEENDGMNSGTVKVVAMIRQMLNGE